MHAIHYATSTSLIWKRQIISAQTLRMNLSAKGGDILHLADKLVK